MLKSTSLNKNRILSNFFESAVPKPPVPNIYISEGHAGQLNHFAALAPLRIILLLCRKRMAKQMEAQKKVAKRICLLCQMQGLSYYALSYRSAVPMTTLMHIIDGSTKNPGLFTIIKICNGFNMTIKEFFDAEEFIGIEDETE